MEDREVTAWRRLKRAELLASRAALAEAAHREASRAILAHLASHFPALRSVGFYWPIRREVDLLPFIDQVIAAGGSAALPVVIGPDLPLEFRAWHRDTAMAVGAYDIPYPAQGQPVMPAALLVPLLGFDGLGYRLGYGGGFYDRTLAAASPRPLTIGIGFELGRLATIHPRPYDIAMDHIVTERGPWSGTS